MSLTTPSGHALTPSRLGGVNHWTATVGQGRVVLVAPYQGWPYHQILWYHDATGYRGQQHFSNADSFEAGLTGVDEAIAYYGGTAPNKMGRWFEGCGVRS